MESRVYTAPRDGVAVRQHVEARLIASHEHDAQPNKTFAAEPPYDWTKNDEQHCRWRNVECDLGDEAGGRIEQQPWGTGTFMSWG